MPPLVVAFAVTYAWELIGLAVISSTVAIKTYLDSDSFQLGDDEPFYESVIAKETETKELIETESNKVISDVETFILTAPIVEDTQIVSTTAPTTMPMYLAQQNELLAVQNEKSNNLISQTKFQNELLAKSIQSQIVSNANSKMIAETLASSLPALVMQMQQISKIPMTMKTVSDVNVAYNELNLTHNEAMLQTLSELTYALNSNALGSISSAESMSAVALNAVAQQKVAEHQTTVAQITRMDGTVYAELAPMELGVQKDIATLEAKTKEKEISDYQTTIQDITNLDGNTVARMKPMEAHAVKSITDAKNATDEMEFELDDSILDEVFAPLVLPTFTARDYTRESNFIFKGEAYE